MNEKVKISFMAVRKVKGILEVKIIIQLRNGRETLYTVLSPLEVSTY